MDFAALHPAVQIVYVLCVTVVVVVCIRVFWG